MHRRSAPQLVHTSQRSADLRSRHAAPPGRSTERPPSRFLGACSSEARDRCATGNDISLIGHRCRSGLELMLRRRRRCATSSPPPLPRPLLRRGDLGTPATSPLRGPGRRLRRGALAELHLPRSESVDELRRRPDSLAPSRRPSVCYARDDVVRLATLASGPPRGPSASLRSRRSRDRGREAADGHALSRLRRYARLAPHEGSQRNRTTPTGCGVLADLASRGPPVSVAQVFDLSSFHHDVCSTMLTRGQHRLAPQLANAPCGHVYVVRALLLPFPYLR